jgi:hypothetical protein
MNDLIECRVVCPKTWTKLPGGETELYAITHTFGNECLLSRKDLPILEAMNRAVGYSDVTIWGILIDFIESLPENSEIEVRATRVDKSEGCATPSLTDQPPAPTP